MKDLKPPITYDEQIAKLEQRGCSITDKEQTKKILSQINYYKISAYLLPFKTQNDKYQNIDFNRLYNIYLFDRELRNLILEMIEPIETDLKTKLAYYCAHKYGSEGYLNKNNFNAMHNHTKFLETIEKLKRKQKDKLYVKHHKKNYNSRFPIWVMVEMFSLTTTSIFYSDLKISDQKQIAHLYRINYAKLKSWFHCITILRNICAHTDRVYYNTFTQIPKGFNNNSRNRSLWPLFVIIKELYPDKNTWNNEILSRFKNLIKKYESHIDLYHLGFEIDFQNNLKK